MVGTKCGWKQVLWVLCEAHLGRAGVSIACVFRAYGRFTVQ